MAIAVFSLTAYGIMIVALLMLPETRGRSLMSLEETRGETRRTGSAIWAPPTLTAASGLSAKAWGAEGKRPMLSRFATLATSIGHARARNLLVACGLVIGLVLAAAAAWFVIELRRQSTLPTPSGN